jgi:hypothetical protein
VSLLGLQHCQRVSQSPVPELPLGLRDCQPNREEDWCYSCGNANWERCCRKDSPKSKWYPKGTIPVDAAVRAYAAVRVSNYSSFLEFTKPIGAIPADDSVRVL